MSSRAGVQLFFHGSIVLLGGMLSGLPLGVAIADDWGAAAVHAWAVTHSSLVSAGILLIALGAVGRQLVMTGRTAACFLLAIVGSTYVLGAGLVVSAITGMNGLTPGGSLLNAVLHLANVVGAVGALVAAVLLVRGAHAALRREGRALVPAELRSPMAT